jgi:hypothetical protein
VGVVRADSNILLNGIGVTFSATGSSSFGPAGPIDRVFDGAINTASGSTVYGAFNTSPPNSMHIRALQSNGSFTFSSLVVSHGLDGNGAGPCNTYATSITVKSAATLADYNGSVFTVQGTASPSACGSQVFNFSPAVTAYAFVVTFASWQNPNGIQPPLQEIEGYGSVQSTPTVTRTATVTYTSTRTFTPTQTPINVNSGCGLPGQPPCHVYWLTPGPIYWTTPGVITGHVQIDNWPTPLPTATMFGGGAVETAVAVGTATIVPPSPSEDGDPFDWSYGDYHFITTQGYDFGCPLNMSIFNTTICVKYREIQAVNMLAFEFPGWLGLFFIGATIISMVVHK